MRDITGMTSSDEMTRCSGTLHEDICGFQFSSVNEDTQKDRVTDEHLGMSCPSPSADSTSPTRSIAPVPKLRATGTCGEEHH